jgi:hypothetical protein
MLSLSMEMPDPSEYSAEERRWLEQTQRFWREESGYFVLQSTKPQTLAYGLNDSPWVCAPGSWRSGGPGAIAEERSNDGLPKTSS